MQLRRRASSVHSRVRRRDERGVALVEFAVVAPLLVAIVAGIIDFGFLFNDVISVRQGTRDAARNAAVGKFGSDTSCTTTGGVSGGALKVICMAKGRDDIPDADTALRIVVGAVGCSGAACYAVGQPIAICEQDRYRAISGMTTAIVGKVVTTRTVLRIEAVSPTDTLASDSSETPLSGASIACTRPPPVT
jgi:hypothetical protein